MRDDADGRHAQLQFQHLMDAAPVMIWVSGRDKRCTWFNRPWLDFTGRAMEQELGEGWAEGVHPDDFHRCLAVYVSHFDERRPFRMDYRLRRADGEYRWLLDTGVPRFDADRAFLGYIGSCIDINALKKAELGLPEIAASRDAVLDAADRIAAGIAHEFSNLLMALMSDLWAIRKSADDPAAVRQRAGEAEEALGQAGRIVEQLLAAVSRPRASRPVQVNRLVRDMWTILRGAVGERFKVEMALAAEPDGAVIDPAHCQTAALNLVRNARDAMSDGGIVRIVTRNVTVRLESIDEPDLAPGRYVMLAVEDDGVGMTPEIRRRAFEPFFTTKQNGHGTGLGLAQVREFARHAGGTVQIATAPGRGTSVRIYLPESDNGARRPCAERGRP
jgi:PAS domain S-box-containing protein